MSLGNWHHFGFYSDLACVNRDKMADNGVQFHRLLCKHEKSGGLETEAHFGSRAGPVSCVTDRGIRASFTEQRDCCLTVYSNAQS